MKIDKDKLLNRLKKIGLLTLWVLMIGGLVVSLAFVNREHESLRCTGVSVRISPASEILFVDRPMVLRAIRSDGLEKKVLGQDLSVLNIPALEKKLINNKMVRNAEVYTDMNGMLHLEISQREPVLRVLRDDGTGYYIDRDGLKMPLSTRFTAHVPVATGNIYEDYDGNDSTSSFVASELFKIATYVDKDAFWKAQIDQIFVTAESELVLIPKLGNHEIIFGTTENMDDKFNRLMLFYKEGLSRVGWEKYKAINLKYKNQVVAVKR